MNFALLFFQYHKTEKAVANTEYLRPIPLLFASNGVRLQDDEVWISQFFDDEDANLSYEILWDAIRTSPDIPDEPSGKALSINIFIIEEVLKNLQKL